MWNQKQLSPPPTNSFKVTFTHDLRQKLLHAQKQLNDGKQESSTHLSVLKSEQYVLGRMIYKLSSQFRSEKSLKHMKQARVCLNRLKELNIERQLDELNIMLDIDFQEEDCAYLPSRQMLQYHLVRLMSTAALLSRTCQLTSDAYFHAKQLMEIGNMLPQNLILVAIAARIWMTCKSLRSCVCVLYQALFPLLDHLQATPVPWLKCDSENEEVLPVCLTIWLQSQFGMETFTEEDSMITSAGDVKLDSDETDEDVDSYGTDKQTPVKVMEDIGEPIERKRKEHTSDKATIAGPNPETAMCVELADAVPTKDKGQGVTTESIDRKTVKKHLEKKLKTLAKILKYLKVIQSQKPLSIGSFEFETTPAIRKKAGNILLKCRSFMKQNTKDNDNAVSIFANYKKLLIGKLLRLKRKYIPKMLKLKTAECNFEHTGTDKLVKSRSEDIRMSKQNENINLESDICFMDAPEDIETLKKANRNETENDITSNTAGNEAIVKTELSETCSVLNSKRKQRENVSTKSKKRRKNQPKDENAIAACVRVKFDNTVNENVLHKIHKSSEELQNSSKNDIKSSKNGKIKKKRRTEVKENGIRQPDAQVKVERKQVDFSKEPMISRKRKKCNIGIQQNKKKNKKVKYTKLQIPKKTKKNMKH